MSTTKAEGNKLASVYAVTGQNSNDDEWNDYLGSNLSSSTTGNIYGIYDMAGGSWEMTAGYINNGKTGNGTSVVTGGNKSTKYATVYPYSSTSDAENADGENINDAELSQSAAVEHYSLNDKIYGDSIRETSTEGKGATSWDNDYSEYLARAGTFTVRGGGAGNGDGTGVSSFKRNEGGAFWYIGFRSVLV